MPFLKRTIMWTLFLAAMYFGGAGTQSSSNFLQGMGFVSMVVACICLYVIFKLIWGPLGNFTRTLLVSAVLVYTAFSIGLFNGNTLQSFLNGSPRPIQPPTSEGMQTSLDDLEMQMFGAINETQQENISVNSAAENVGQNNMSRQISVSSGFKTGGIWQNIKSLFGGNKSEQEGRAGLDPMQYPEMHGHPKVISGSVLMLNGVKIKLFGIEAPEPTQTCENKYGNSYICGKEAIIWMRNWLNRKDVSCRILSRINKGWTTGICFSQDGKYDVAAAVVSAGWAVAYTEHTQIYVPYEQQAAMQKRGLWAGRFYKPWDWRIIQSRKADIKINSPQNNKWFNFKGLF